MDLLWFYLREDQVPDGLEVLGYILVAQNATGRKMYAQKEEILVLLAMYFRGM